MLTLQKSSSNGQPSLKLQASALSGGGGGSADLLGLNSAPSAPVNNEVNNTTGTLIDVLGGLGGESSTDPISNNRYDNVTFSNY